MSTKRLLARAAPLPLAAATFTLAALLITPVLLVEPSVRRPLAEAWPLLVYLGVGPTALAYILFTVGLRRVPPPPRAWSRCSSRSPPPRWA